jgi:hypothetical protein
MTNPFTPARRRWIYSIAVALIPVLIAVGWMTPQAGALALPLILALLNVHPPRR